MTEFLHRLQDNPRFSQLGALLCQRDRLDSHTSHESPAFNANTTFLNSYEVSFWPRYTALQTDMVICMQVFRNLSVAVNHLDLLRFFPSNFRFIILQHNPDM